MPQDIVIADDESHVLNILEMKLAKAGYSVHKAIDGQQALELCHRARPDLLITDCQMPRMDGLQLCDALMSEPALAEVPKIMLTSRGFEIDNDRRREAGIHRLLSKPFSPREVLDAVADVLGTPAGDAAAPSPKADKPASTPGDTAAAAETLAALRSAVEGFALNVWVCDGVGEPPSAFAPSNPLCQADCPPPHPCVKALTTLGRKALVSRSDQSQRIAKGCCAVAAPVGGSSRSAALVSYPTPAVADQADPGKLAEAWQLTADQARAAAGKACRFDHVHVEDVLRLLRRQAAVAGELSRVKQQVDDGSRNLATTYEELSLVYRIAREMKADQDPAEFLRGVCDRLQEVLGVPAVSAIVQSPCADMSDLAVTTGSVELNEDQVRLLAVDLATRLGGEDNEPIIDNDYQPDEGLGLGAGVQRLVATNLKVGAETRGTLIAYNRPDGDFDSMHSQLLQAVGSQAAVFLANHVLYSDLNGLLMGVLHALVSSIDAKDAYTRGHSERVARISMILAQKLGMDDAQAERYYLAGLLHDIGKIGVPESILCKTSKLTDEEFGRIKEHPSIGADILGGIRHLEDAAVGMLTHHERPDGRGYPRGLTGDEVPLVGRIVGLADTFDAMTSSRTYRKALDLEKVRSEIERCAGTQFDPQLAEIMLSMDLEDLLARLQDPDDRTGRPPGLSETIASAQMGRADDLLQRAAAREQPSAGGAA